jgi:predicted Fe-S protein YdhL (DUF1289 family)
VTTNPPPPDALDSTAPLAARARAIRKLGGDPPSPCVSICRIDETSGLCLGCLRSLAEIAGWSRADDAAKRSIWRAIELRAEAGLPNGA